MAKPIPVGPNMSFEKKVAGNIKGISFSFKLGWIGQIVSLAQLGSSSSSSSQNWLKWRKKNPIGVSNRVEENQKSTLRFTTLNEGRGEFVENLEEKVSFSYRKYETFLEYLFTSVRRILLYISATYLLAIKALILWS